MRLASLLLLVAGFASNAQSQVAASPEEPGKARVWICADTNDDWNPVGATGDPEKHEKGKPPVFTWKAGKQFNVLIKNPKGVKFGGYLGFVVHKQNADLTDGDFVDEKLIESSDDSTMWASTEGIFTLEAGVYNIWIIHWGDRDVNYHSGNFKKYLAKVTLKVE